MLHRRNSTATDAKFPMYLISLDQLQRLYGGTEPRYDRIEAHQELLRRGELVRWVDLPIDAHIIFFSHEWIGWNHPDPHGVQLKTFLRAMKRLRSGEISQVEMNVFHTLMYKTNHVVKAEKWQDILSRAYVVDLLTLSYTFTYVASHEQVRLDRLVVDASAIRVSSEYRQKSEGNTRNESRKSCEIDSCVRTHFSFHTPLNSHTNQ